VSAITLITAIAMALVAGSADAPRPTEPQAQLPDAVIARIDAVAPTLPHGAPANPDTLRTLFGPGTGFELVAGPAMDVELVATWVRDGRPYRALHSVPLTLRPGRRVSIDQALPLEQLGLDHTWRVSRAHALAESDGHTASVSASASSPERSWLMITAVPVNLPEHPPTIDSLVIQFER